MLIDVLGAYTNLKEQTRGGFRPKYFGGLPLPFPLFPVNIWESYGQESSVLFFLTHGVVSYLCCIIQCCTAWQLVS